jgi:hypothetical protein
MHFENQSGAFHLVTYLHDQEILLRDFELDCEAGEINFFVVFGCGCCGGQGGQENEILVNLYPTIPKANPPITFPKNGFLTFSLAHHSICLYCGS